MPFDSLTYTLPTYWSSLELSVIFYPLCHCKQLLFLSRQSLSISLPLYFFLPFPVYPSNTVNVLSQHGTYCQNYSDRFKAWCFHLTWITHWKCFESYFPSLYLRIVLWWFITFVEFGFQWEGIYFISFLCLKPQYIC